MMDDVTLRTPSNGKTIDGITIKQSTATFEKLSSWQGIFFAACKFEERSSSTEDEAV